MVEKKKLVPELRFPEFDGEWELKKTKDIAPLQRGFDLPNSQIENGLFPVVYSNGILKFHSEYKSKGPGVVTGRSGTIGNVTYVEDNYWPHNTSLWVTDFKGNNPKYIYYFYVNFKLWKYNAGSTVPTLNRNDVHSILKSIPTLPEQQKIVEFLSAIDKRIQQLQKKKVLLETYKKGVMQHIFSQKIRFKDENGIDFPDWKEKKLGEIGSTYGGLSGKSKEHFGSGKPYVQYMQIFSYSVVRPEDFGYVEISSDEKQNQVRNGDVFFTTSSETPNEIGTASVMLSEIEEVYLNSFCFGFRPKSLEVLDPNYSRYLFRSTLFRSKIIVLAQGSTRFNMSKVELMKLTILLPHIKEQRKIADLLSNIDASIEQLTSQFESTKSFKKGLFQKMFI